MLEELEDKDSLTPNQAVACLGRSVHVGVATSVVGYVIDRLTSDVLTYASACSGIDTFACAVERATGGVFQYRFASEKDAKLRGALVDAWRSYGLTESKVYSDAASAAATGGDPVDIWFFLAGLRALLEAQPQPQLG